MNPNPYNVRDPRRSYYANKVRNPRVVRPAPAQIDVSPGLVLALVNTPPERRVEVLMRVQDKHGTEYATQVANLVAEKLQEMRTR